MSGARAAGSEAAVLRAVLDVVRSDAGVREIFGNPPRVFDDETRQAEFPYADVATHEVRPADSSEIPGAEHRISFGVLTRHGGRAEAKEGIGAIRAAIETADISPEGQRVVLAHAVYSDVVRRGDKRAFRGLLRFKIITEEAA